MRLNKYIAQSTSLSRRAADEAVYRNRVLVNGRQPSSGQDIADSDQVTLDGSAITPAVSTTTIMLNKPVGYVCSRDGQGSATIYDILPSELQNLQAVGRLDKASSGLLLLTSDGQLAQRLTHPKYEKIKIYDIALRTALQPLHRQLIADKGISLADGPSQFQLDRTADGDDRRWIVTMHEGRNRQIRRTFEALGYDVVKLHRTAFGDYKLGLLASGSYIVQQQEVWSS